MKIRLATPEDAAQLAEMRWDFRNEYEAPPDLPPSARAEFLAACMDFIHSGIASGRWAAWIAAEGETILSHLFIQRIPRIPKLSNPAPEFGYISNVYTRPPWRGQGIGAQLMETAKTWAQAEHLDMFVLWPVKGRENFYQRSGFHPDSSMQLDFK